MDDLGQSIKDKRFYEQKFRLKQSGLHNIIYLIEHYGRNQHVGLPITTLFQAAVNTLIQDNFIVKFTDNPRGTCEYLGSLSKFFNKLFKVCLFYIFIKTTRSKLSGYCLILTTIIKQGCYIF